MLKKKGKKKTNTGSFVVAAVAAFVDRPDSIDSWAARIVYSYTSRPVVVVAVDAHYFAYFVVVAFD